MAEFDPNNPDHNPLEAENGKLVPQHFDPNANSGNGGFVVLTEEKMRQMIQVDINDSAFLTAANPGNVIPRTSGNAELFTEAHPGAMKQVGSIVAVNSDGSVLDTDVKEYRCVSTDTKIDASTVPKYSTLIEMDTNNIYYSNGSSWVVY